MKFFSLLTLLKAKFFRLPSFVFLLISLLSATLHASENTKQLNFKQFSTAEGLSQSYVFSIVQDKQGFIWFATQDGLNRFDGFDFVHYRNDIDDSKTLADNFVRTLFIDSQGTLWAGTANGLSRYNREEDNFTNFFTLANDKSSLKDNTVWTLFEGRDKNGSNQLLVATESGLHRFNPTTQNFTRIIIDDIQGRLVEIKTIFQDKNNDYWFGTYENGIYIANQALSKGKRLSGDGNPSAKWGFAVDATGMFDFKVIDENYWLGTNNGLYIFSPKQELLAHKTFESTQGRILSDTIRTVTEYDEHSVVLGTTTGLVSVDRYHFSVTPLAMDTNTSTNISNTIMSSLKARDGSLWLGTYNEGAYKNHPNFSMIHRGLSHLTGDDNSISHIAELSNKNIWFLNESGEIFELSNSSPKIGKVSGIEDVKQIIAIEDTETILIYTDDGVLYRKKSNSVSFERVENWSPEQLPPTDSLIHYFNNEICFINNISWLSCTNLDTGSHSQAIPEGEDAVTAITVQNDGSLLLVTESNNIYEYQKSADKFDFIFSLGSINKSSFRAKSIKKSKGLFWLESFSHGLLAISSDLKKSYLFNENNQLVKDRKSTRLNSSH